MFKVKSVGKGRTRSLAPGPALRTKLWSKTVLERGEKRIKG